MRGVAATTDRYFDHFWLSEKLVGWLVGWVCYEGERGLNEG